MSLAFALMAAINGSTAPEPRCRTGSNYRTKPRRPRPGGTKDSHPSWVAAQGAARDAVGKRRGHWICSQRVFRPTSCKAISRPSNTLGG